MNIAFRRSLDRLRRRALHLGGMVEDQVEKASKAIEGRDAALAAQVIAGDGDVDALEQEIEEECLHLLALHQPVAFDLRMLMSILKMNGQLERMGSLAVNLAQQAELLSKRDPIDAVPFDLPAMTDTARRMLHMALDAVLELDPDTARRVRQMDDGVDDIHRGMYDAICEAIQAAPERGATLILYIGVSRQFERLADYACGIAKDVIYLTEGEIVRHKADPPAPPRDADRGEPPRDEPA